MVTCLSFPTKISIAVTNHQPAMNFPWASHFSREFPRFSHDNHRVFFAKAPVCWRTWPPAASAVDCVQPRPVPCCDPPGRRPRARCSRGRGRLVKPLGGPRNKEKKGWENVMNMWKKSNKSQKKAVSPAKLHLFDGFYQHKSGSSAKMEIWMDLTWFKQ